MNPTGRWLAGCALLIVVVCCLAADTDHRPNEYRSWWRLPWESDEDHEHENYIPPNYPAVPFDRYLTWHNFDGMHDPQEQAVFVWQGLETGKGAEGFKAVLRQLEGLPPSTRILVYPDYEGGYWVGVAGGPRRFPFDRQKLVRAAVAQKVILLFSDRDHEGKLFPEAEERLDELRKDDERSAYRFAPYRKEPNGHP